MNYAKTQRQVPGAGLSGVYTLKPHWYLLAVSILCWLYYFYVWLQPMDSHHHHHHAHQVSFTEQQITWLMMVYAMMLPMLSGAVNFIREMLPRYVHPYAWLAVFIGYSALWWLVGALLIAVGVLLSSAVWIAEYWPAWIKETTPFSGLIWLGAALYCQSGMRKSAVYACTAGQPLAIDFWGAMRGSVKFGWYKAQRCFASCGVIMLAMMLTGHSLGLMLAVTCLLLYERIKLPKRTSLVSAMCYTLALFYTGMWLI
ncbi:copper chaperone [Planctobacterium marinum]|uniref:copper chaperone n=1 Tax=Planctobacterium marinum TaxID=1631968 RepID=UPI001E5600AA|nr:DUF2182 domain-containing protein [Planctobacterium marinum]MCC2607010.1 DUF2182 domain-containing protein [Planctobacterium marinum]